MRCAKSTCQNAQQAEQDLRAIGGAARSSIAIGRYADRAEMCRVLASWVDDELRRQEGGHQRQVELDDRGMFPGTLAP